MDGNWVPYFLREKGVRRSLQNLYGGLVGSTANARVLVEQDIESIKGDSACGNPEVIAKYMNALRWLKHLKAFCRSPEAFSNQFLEPVKTSARFIERVHEVKPSTTELRGLVFRKSPPFYNPHTGENQVTLSVALPALGIVSSLRCRCNVAKNADFGFLDIRGVQPIPFLNRIHPVGRTSLELRVSNAPTRLGDFNFRKVSFNDVEYFSQSLNFEDFCEIWSEQKDEKTGHGRRLGYAAVLGGLVQSAGTGPNIVLQDPCNSESSLSLYVTGQFLKLLDTDLARLSDLRGKFVRIFVVFWYRYGSLGSTPEVPEALASELVPIGSELVTDDLIGFVRVRGKASLDSLAARYSGVNMSSLQSPLVIEDNTVFYDFSTETYDRVIRIFAEEENAIRFSRRKLLTEVSQEGLNPFVRPECVFDLNRLSVNGLAEWVTFNKSLLDSLLALIAKIDMEGDLPSIFKEIIDCIGSVSSQDTREDLYWLRNLGLFITPNSRAKRQANITEKGRKIAYAAVRSDLVFGLKKFMERKTVIDLLETQGELPLPPSILLDGLRELEKEGFARSIVIRGRECEIFWTAIKDQLPASKHEALTRLERLEAKVIGALKDTSFSYPLRTSAILSKVVGRGDVINQPVLRIVLTELKRQGRIQEQERGMWRYPLENRIYDVLKRDICEVFRKDEIATEAGVAPMENHLREIERILREMENRGAVTEIFDGWWSAAPAKIDYGERLSCGCRKISLHLLKESGGAIRKDHLVHRIITTFLAPAMKKAGIGGSYWQIAQEAINEMVQKGEISVKGEYYTFPSQEKME